MKTSIALAIAALAILALAGCANPPSFQSQTTVLGLEVETVGSISSGETPMPKLRFGLIHHQGQIVQQAQAASMYSAKSDLNLWTASGSMLDEYSVEPVK